MRNVSTIKSKSMMPVNRNSNLLAIIWKERFSYLLILPSFIATAIFSYWPMYGILLAFKNYSFKLGIMGSPWAEDFGFKWFKIMFRDPAILNVLKNTLIISFSKIFLGTTACILFALLLNELRSEKYKRIVQTASYLPHFLSWIVMAGIVYTLFTINGGVFNKIVTDVFQGQPVQILANPKYFRLLLYVTSIWKEVGFGTIIYLAAISSINPELYESAIIDGASRLKRVIFITLPSIKGTIVLLLILSFSGILSAGFDQVFNLYSPQVMEVGDIIDTFVFRKGIQGMAFSYTTAIEFARQLVAIIMLVTVNFIAKVLGEEGIY